MNLENIRRVREAIAAADEDTVSMSSFFRGVGPYDDVGILGKCGTAGCIAGWTVSIFRRGRLYGDLESSASIARQELGLCLAWANELFYAISVPKSISGITKQQVLDQLDFILDGNPPNWKATLVLDFDLNDDRIDLVE